MSSSVIASRLYRLAAEMHEIADLMREESRREPMPREYGPLVKQARELSGAARHAAEWARSIGADPDPSEAA